MSDRRWVLVAALAVGLAAFVGQGPATRTQPGFERWTRSLPISAPAAGCVHGYVARGLLADVPPEELTERDLARHGLEAVPAAQRQLVGDVLIACSTLPGPPGGR